MTSTASPATWLPAATTRAAVVRTPAGPRHRAPEIPGMVEAVASELDLSRRGRHAEPPWSREVLDPRRDEDDAFDWLGFGAGQD
jgi:hypothetical protein